MAYKQLTEELIRTMNELHKVKPHRDMDGFVRGEAFVLQYLKDNCGTTPSELSMAMGTTTARVAATLNSLDKKGMILRHIDPDDRRRIIVELTAEGNQFAEEQQQKMKERIEKMLRSLGEDDAKEYIRILKKLIAVNKEKEN